MSNATQTLLSAQLERQLRNEQLADRIANRNYQDEVTGPEDTVRILTAQNGTVSDYTGGSVAVDSQPTLPLAQLAMDHKKVFSFSVDGDTNVTRYAQQLANETFAEVLEEADIRILSESTNAGTDFGTFTSGTDAVEDLFGSARSSLTNQGTPQNGRTAVVPPSVGTEVYKKIQERQSQRGDEQLQRTSIGRYFGFEVFERPESFFAVSNTNPLSLFSHRDAITYADAVVSVQVLTEVEGRPGSVVIQGLHIAGAVTVKADAMVKAEIA